MTTAIARSPGSAQALLLTPQALPNAMTQDEWADLASSAAEANPFLEPWFLGPSLTHLPCAPHQRIALVRAPDGLLIGLMPLGIDTHYGRFPIRHVRNMLHDNIFLGTPLVRRANEEAFWTALLDTLDADDWAQGLFCVTELDPAGPVAQALDRVAMQRGRAAETVLHTNRALLNSDLASIDYYESTIRKKKRKEIKRLQSRLAEIGTLSADTLTSPQDSAPWIDQFIALEQSGWKGECGAPMGATPATRAFFAEMVTTGLAAGRVEILRLRLDDRPIAMLVNFMTLPGSYSFKIAHDPEFDRYSPGVLIQLENLKLLDRAGFGWMDSCASEDHPMINSIWGERRTLVWKALPLTGIRNALVYKMTRFAEKNWARIKSARRRGASPANDNRDGDTHV